MNPAPKPKKRAPKIRKPIPRGGPPKKRNAQRKRKNHARAYGPAERIEFVKSLPCILWGKVLCVGWTEVMHVESGGMGRKADANKTCPACQYHHEEAHVKGQKSFEAWYSVDLKHEAELTEEKWQAHKQKLAA